MNQNKSNINTDIQNESNNNTNSSNRIDEINNCEIIQDLLPLYQDNICSGSSRKIIEKHLSECQNCTALRNKLQNNQIEEQLVQEKESVLKTHSKKERKKTFTIGIATAGVLMIPILVCLICNLAIGHGLDWFFIVLTALLLTASLTVVPLIVDENAALWTLSSFVISLLLLLMTICIYTRGNWFFLAAVPSIFGLSVLFMPYVIYHIPLPKALSKSKGLLVMLWDTVWLYSVIIVCGLYSGNANYWRIALEITSFCLLLPWILFLMIRYLQTDTFIKAGICTLFAGIFSSLINPAIALILEEPERLITNADFIFWNNAAINAVTGIAILVITVPAGIILLIKGCFRKPKNNET